MELHCIFCNKTYSINSGLIRCSICNQPLIITYEDLDAKNFILNHGLRSIWRYGLIPHPSKEPISLGEGGTFLQNAVRLEEYFDAGSKIYLKDESRNPTGSFVDRGVSVAISYAVYAGYNCIVNVSPGNLGVSIAAYASRAGVLSEIYLPRFIEQGKLYQILMHGGDVNIYNDFGATVSQIYHIYEEQHSFYPIMSDNPFYIEGVKTISYEIYEDLGGGVPEYIVVPMGNGALIYSIWKGFSELYRMGLIENLPRLIGVQLRGAAKIIEELYGGETSNIRPLAPEISIDNPLNINHAIYAIKESGGYGMKVDYDEVVESLKLISSLEGLIIELAAASTISALKKLLDRRIPEKVVLIMTGHGLKDPSTVRELTRNARKKLGIESVQRSAIGRTKVEIMRAIYLGFNYGYNIKKYLESSGMELSLPTIYQHLSELENMGLVKLSRSIGIGRRKSIYELTEKGAALLKALG